MEGNAEVKKQVEEVVKQPQTSKATKLEIAFKAWQSAKARQDALKEELKPISIEVKSHEETIVELANELMEEGATELAVGDLGKVVKKYSHVPKIDGEVTLMGFLKIAKKSVKNGFPIFNNMISAAKLKGLIDNKIAFSAFQGEKLEKGKYDKKIRKSFSRFGFKGFVKQISFGIVANK